MPLIKSTSKKAFGENIARERAAGRPEKQSVAIAYSERREAAGGSHHSEHSRKRSEQYRREIAATEVRPSARKMTRSEHQLDNDEDSDE